MYSRHRRTRFRLLSALLLTSGAFLLGRGAREILDSRWGQRFGESLPMHSGATGRPKLGEPVAKLAIPRLGTELYVFEGTDDKDLLLGPGHMPGTALPGQKGNCVIAGHRDTHFRVLRKIRQGDDITLETSGGRFIYTVDQTEIVRPTNTSPLQPTKSGVLNLITCYPFYYLGNAPERFVVRARLETVQSPTPNL